MAEETKTQEGNIPEKSEQAKQKTSQDTFNEISQRRFSDPIKQKEFMRYVASQKRNKKLNEDLLEKYKAEFEEDAYMNEKVPFYAIKDNNEYKDDITVVVNGKSWIIQRGKHVHIPRFVAHVIENSNRQAALAADISANFSERFENRTKEMII